LEPEAFPLSRRETAGLSRYGWLWVVWVADSKTSYDKTKPKKTGHKPTSCFFVRK